MKLKNYFLVILHILSVLIFIHFLTGSIYIFLVLPITLGIIRVTESRRDTNV